MSFFRKRAGSFRHALIITLGFIIGVLSITAAPITAFADPDDPDVPDVRIPAYETTAVSTLVHTHRGSSSAEGGCYTVPVMHSHSGDASSGGPCYSPVYHSHSSSCYGICTCYAQSANYIGESPSYCSIHGSVGSPSYSVVISHSSCGSGPDYTTITVGCPLCGGVDVWGPSTHTYLHCGRGGAIDGYTFNCSKTEGVDIDYYDPGCGLEEEEYGSVSITNSTPGWTSGNVTLTGSLNDPLGVISEGGYGVMDFTAADGNIESNSESSCIVTENGTYTVNISVDEARFDTSMTSATINVRNIDRTAPVIDSVAFDTATDWLLTNTITVSARDLQPDGSEGSGIAGSGYSFDGGVTWQSENTFAASENGVYEIRVKDYCGNIAETSVEIGNIDNSGPDVTYTFTPAAWYSSSGPREYTFTADDEEAGLDDLPFSYDGGETWTDEEVFLCPAPGPFTVLVRDKLGNITEITIDNQYTPVIPEEEPEGGGESGGDGNGGDNGNDGNDSLPGNTPVLQIPDDNDAGVASGDGGMPYSGSSPAINTANNANADNGPVLTKSEEKRSGDRVYFEQIPSSASPSDGGDTGNITRSVPFYKTTAFIAAASVGGGLAGTGIIVMLFMLLYSGVIIYTYDGSRYRLTGIRPVRRCERGRYVYLSGDLIESGFSSRFRFRLGRIYVRLHKNELIHIKAGEEWLSSETERYIYKYIKYQDPGDQI